MNRPTNRCRFRTCAEIAALLLGALALPPADAGAAERLVIRAEASCPERPSTAAQIVACVQERVVVLTEGENKIEAVVDIAVYYRKELVDRGRSGSVILRPEVPARLAHVELPGEVEIPGGDQFIPGGDMFIPGGDMFVAGEDEYLRWLQELAIDDELPEGSTETELAIVVRPRSEELLSRYQLGVIRLPLRGGSGEEEAR